MMTNKGNVQEKMASHSVIMWCILSVDEFVPKLLKGSFEYENKKLIDVASWGLLL